MLIYVVYYNENQCKKHIFMHNSLLSCDIVEDVAIPMYQTTSDASSTSQLSVDEIDLLTPFDYKDPFVEVPPSDNLP
ncbi:hypothetical protein CTI12_AA578460 [Artemisia annua]|uniref:Uncharacterized protein n=1 Tax=Artemisia annua TaxID=35608 RepID=A0A2U1KPS5_ARTAN|nr:hypothetical protein CTI12_AA578460 [Artemisia annua]